MTTMTQYIVTHNIIALLVTMAIQPTRNTHCFSVFFLHWTTRHSPDHHWCPVVTQHRPKPSSSIARSLGPGSSPVPGCRLWWIWPAPIAAPSLHPVELPSAPPSRQIVEIIHLIWPNLWFINLWRATSLMNSINSNGYPSDPEPTSLDPDLGLINSSTSPDLAVHKLCLSPTWMCTPPS